MTTSTEQNVQSFQALGLSEPLLQALAHMGWEQPSEIQAKMIPVALTGRDILGQARTGTGKTGAFGLPILQRLSEGEGVRCLILTPTRELAVQVAEELRAMAKHLKHRVALAYGGTRLHTQMQAIRKGPAIVVGTPGRVMDLMGRGVLKIDALQFAVLDEVDRMLDIGFRDDIRKILGAIKSEHQTIFVSATIEGEINRLARTYMHEPAEVFCAPDKLTVEEVEQCYVSVQPRDKARLLIHLLKSEKPELAIVFTATKRGADKVAQRLKDAGVNAREIHGDLYQQKRERIMKSFREGSLHVLVATDVASRGIDVDNISHIINYDIPDEASAYVHRIGRTARMGEKGKAIAFVTPEQGDQLTTIEMLINQQIPRMEVEGFEFSPPETTPEPPKPAKPVVSRLTASVHGDSEAAPVRKTLGSKFRTTRRKRLRR